MITSNRIKEIVSNHLDGSEIYIVDAVVRPGNKIVVQIDSNKGVSIDECVLVHRAIEESLDRDVEDFELEVSSPGLTLPFKVVQQYIKNIGKEVEVLLKDGEKKKGKLVSASTETFTIETQEMIKVDGKGKAQSVTTQEHFNLEDVKSTKVVINF